MNFVLLVPTDDGKICLNVDNEEDRDRWISQGAKVLTPQEVKLYGMEGYENWISPENTVVNKDGSVTFTPPDFSEWYRDELRTKRRERLTEYDSAVAQLSRAIRLADDDEKAALEDNLRAWDEYGRALVAIMDLPGSPWDGGGNETPWPEKPEMTGRNM